MGRLVWGVVGALYILFEKFATAHGGLAYQGVHWVQFFSHRKLWEVLVPVLSGQGLRKVGGSSLTISHCYVE